MVQRYDHRAASIVVHPENVHRPAQPRAATDEEHADPAWQPDPQFWVPVDQCPSFGGLEWVICFKEITSPTNARTMIAALAPCFGFGNKVPILAPTDTSSQGLRSYQQNAPLLLANLNSFALDFVARQKVHGQTINLFILEQFPVLSPEAYEGLIGGTRIAGFVREQVLRLTYTANDMAPFARDLGRTGKPFPWDEDDRRHRMARLDALFFHLYGIGRDDVEYLLDQFPIIRAEDEARFGDYRTKRLVLAYLNAVAAGDLEEQVSL